jgi:hypothetical protein
MDSNYVLLFLVALFLLYFMNSKEGFENQDKSRACSRRAIDQGIYRYQVNMINRGAR